MIQILYFRPAHIDAVAVLTQEFDVYLQSISNVRREDFDIEKKKENLRKYGFWKQKSFSGYIAKVDDEIIGYALYHYGFDPDEMQWKVIHIVDFFVSERARNKWVGRALIEKLQSHEDSIGLYFGVWKKNNWAIDFYKKMWAQWCEDVPYMKLIK